MEGCGEIVGGVQPAGTCCGFCAPRRAGTWKEGSGAKPLS